MIYGIEQSYNPRNRESRVKKFSSTKSGFSKAHAWKRQATPKRHRSLWECAGKPSSWKKTYRDYFSEGSEFSVFKRSAEDFRATGIMAVGREML